MVKLKLLIDPKQIAAKIHAVGREIDRDYHGKDLTIVMVLKGAICLVADLIRNINVSSDIEIVQCQSYGKGGIHRGSLDIFGLDRIHLQNRDVLIVDDIFDSGNTLYTLMQAIQEQNPRSIKSLVLLHKNVERSISYRPDYVLFDIENHFVVGYGLDYQERYRGLAGVYILDEVSL